MNDFKAAVLAFLVISPAAAAAQPAFEQLLAPYQDEIAVPAVPLPDRGDAIEHYFPPWDGNAPFSYYQNRAEVSYRAGEHAIVKNVRWGLVPADHKSYVWETLRLDASRLEKAVYGYKTAGTGHTFLVFVFAPGGAVNPRGESARALTFGAEGWSREPHGYAIVPALTGKYPLIWNVTTLDSFIDFTANLKGSPMFFKHLNLDAAQARKLLAGALARMDETNRNREIYNLFTNSCTNNPVDLINAVLPKKQRISLEIIGINNPGASIPVSVVKKYVKKGVLAPGTVKVDSGNWADFDISGI